MGEMIHDVCGGLLTGRELKTIIPGGHQQKYSKQTNGSQEN